MWKFPRSWPNGFGNTAFPDSLILLSLVLFLWGCPPPAALNPPRIRLESPIANLETTPGKSFYEGYAAYQKGDQTRAREQFRKQIQKYPDFYPTHLALAYTFLAEGDPGAAEPYIRKALELAPDYAQAHFALAHVLELRQEYDAAITELDEVGRLNADYPGLSQIRDIIRLKATEQHLGEARRLSGTNPIEALSHFRRAQELAPEIQQIPIDIGRLFLQKGNCAQALPYFESAPDLVREDAGLMLQIADCEYTLMNYEKALSLYRELSLKQPGNEELPDRIKETEKQIAVSRLPDQYRNIPFTPEITRAQLAAYLSMNLDFLQKYRPSESLIVVDILHHWAQGFIQRVVDLGIMDLFPNRTFEPSRHLTKLELARAGNRLLEILGTEGKSIPYNEATPVADVPINNVQYLMITKVLSAGILTPDADGWFHGGRAVSGAEVISMVNRLNQIAE